MLGDNIKKARKNKKISQKKLAQDAGVSTSYIQQLELGQKTNPSVEILLKLAKALNLTIKELKPDISIWDENIMPKLYLSELTTQELIEELNSRNDFPIKINIKE